MLRPENISAIIITRGNVDLTELVSKLPYGEVIVHTSTDEGCFGRYRTIAAAQFDTIYFQDDDIEFYEHDALCAAHEMTLRTQGAAFTSNMPSPWWEEQYKNNDMALVGAGSLVPRDLPWAAFGRYLAEYDKNDLFYNYCDMVHGVLTPYHRVDLGYKILPHASAPGRIYTTPGAAARKQIVIDRALEIRARR